MYIYIYTLQHNSYKILCFLNKVKKYMFKTKILENYYCQIEDNNTNSYFHFNEKIPTIMATIIIIII